MPRSSTRMDAASYALWKELRAPCLKELKPKAIYGGACCLLWLAAGLLFGKPGLLALGLVWFALFLPVGVAHMFLAKAKEDWSHLLSPSSYMLSPFIGLVMLCGRITAVFRGKPLIPTILTGRNVVSISRDVDDGHGYRFTMASGRTVTIVRYHGVPDYFCIRSENGAIGRVVGTVSDVALFLDDGL